MSEEDKEQYVDAAKVTADSVDIPIDSWDDAHRIVHCSKYAEKNVVCIYDLHLTDSSTYDSATSSISVMYPGQL